jgi:flagellar biosynthesis protein FliR
MSVHVNDLELLVPVMARILSAFVTAPIFSQRSVPAIAKIVLAGFLAWLLVAPGGMAVNRPTTLEGWLLGIGAEVAIGLFLGFLSSLAFWALSMAGEFIGLQMGWGFAATLHASLDSSPVPTGQLYTILGILVFLSTGGHHLLIKALADTFVAAPPYSLVLGGAQVERVIDLAGALFSGALQLALPVVGSLMLVEVALAFMTRILPQLNAWIFGMPLKIGVGLLSLWIALPALLFLIARWLSQSPLNMLTVVR